MIQAIKAVLPAFAWRWLRGIATAIAAPLMFTIRTGHWRTALTGRVVDRNGKPIPWYTYPALDFLADKDFHGARVLEFGGGHSTIWWTRRGATVTTIEPDKRWSHWIINHVGAQVYHVPCDAETRDMSGVEAILSRLGEFDVIVIDGHLREECALAAVSHLKPGGAMLIDNFETMDFSGIVSRPGCRKIEFTGHTADGHKPTTTALLFWGDCAMLEVRPRPRLAAVA